MPGQIRLSLLGPVQVERSGRLVRGFESRKELALLGYLATRGQPTPRGQLAELLWPERTEARSRANLSVALHDLNSLIPGCFAADRHAIALAPDLWIDLAAFDLLAGQARPDALATAVDLYREEFMHDLYLDDCPDFEIWLVRLREEWRARVADLLGALVAHHAQRQNHDQAIAFTRRLLAQDPWREEAHCQLMVLLAASGQRGAALAQFDTCRRVLAEELAVDPDPQTIALAERIRAGATDAALLAAPTARLPGAQLAARLLFVTEDRAPGIAESGDALADAVRDPGRIVALSNGQVNGLARQPATDLLTYRLARVAEWSQPRYQLDERFVALTLLVDRGEETTGDRWRAIERRYTDLGLLLDEVPDSALVLLGPPGSGKSTLLRRLELDLALAGMRDERPTVTFLVSLSRFAPERDRPQEEPLAWLARSWRERYPELPPLESLLEAGRLVLLLDGINEMPHAGFADYRERVGLWRDFVKGEVAARPGNRVVFACRSLDYSAPLSTAAMRVPQVRIEALDDGQVRRFLAAYSPRRGEAIWAALAQSGQLDLVRAPYWLRLLIDQHRADGRLARGRAAMFTGFVRGALRREIEWGNPLLAPEELLSEHDHRRVVQARRWKTPWELPEDGRLFSDLGKLAFGMQDRRRGGEMSQVRLDYGEALALVARDAGAAGGAGILKAGEALGVLDEDVEADEVRFYHQLMQEYFAARALARAPDAERVRRAWRAAEITPSVRELIETLRDGETLPPLPQTGWEETTVLAAAMAGDIEGFVRGLMETNLALAGRCASQPEVRERLGEVLLDELRWALVRRSRDAEADLRDRIACELAMGDLGDPRFERRVGPYGEYLMPPLVAIPGGRYPIGKDEPDHYTPMGSSKLIISTGHMPRHEVAIAPYQIGQFPVTNAEWRCFMEAGGYDDEQWWDTEDAWAWRRGELADEGAKVDKRIWRKRFRENPDLLNELVAKGRLPSYETVEQWREWTRLDDAGFEAALDTQWRAKRATEPEFWRDERLNAAGQPVVGVSWYEARAYCNWLGAEAGLAFRLPTEVEWEAAARGGSGRLHAYGDVFDRTRSNIFGTHMHRATPIGVFVDGDTPEAVSDMAGNVEQWTSSAWGGDDDLVPDFKYPYDANDGREDPHAGPTCQRVVRGGAWNFDRRSARATFRNSALPSFRWIGIGFRCCLGPPSSRSTGSDTA